MLLDHFLNINSQHIFISIYSKLNGVWNVFDWLMTLQFIGIRFMSLLDSVLDELLPIMSSNRLGRVALTKTHFLLHPWSIWISWNVDRLKEGAPVETILLTNHFNIKYRCCRASDFCSVSKHFPWYFVLSTFVSLWGLRVEFEDQNKDYKVCSWTAQRNY